MTNSNALGVALVLALAIVFSNAAPSPLKNVQGFTYLGSRSAYSHQAKEFIESNYYASAASGIWTQSADDCLKTFGSDGALVSIETEPEQDAINLWLQERGSGGAIFWTSGLYEIEAGIWRWSGNAEYEFPTYTNWANGTDPVSPNGRQRIGLNHQNRFSASWMSFDDTNLERYICELKSAENVGTGPTVEPTTTTPTTTVPTTTVPTTTLAPTIPVPCNVTVDLVFVADASLSVGPDNFDKLRQFIALCASAFTQHNDTRVGLFTYSDQAQSVISLTNVFSPEEIEKEILEMAYIPGNTATHLGITNATAELMNFSRPSVPKIYVVITDGVSDTKELTKSASEAATKFGIKTYSMGITDLVDYPELVIIAGGKPDNVDLSPDWENIDNLVGSVTNKLCPKP